MGGGGKKESKIDTWLMVEHTLEGLIWTHYYTRLYIGDLCCIVLSVCFHALLTMDTPPTLLDILENIRTCSVSNFDMLVSDLSLDSDARIPLAFLSGLNDNDRTICWHAILLCYMITWKEQIPREMQLQAVLAHKHGLNCLISAGTGSGKTLPTALKIMLDNPKDFHHPQSSFYGWLRA